jgi:hypothetical protein
LPKCKAPAIGAPSWQRGPPGGDASFWKQKEGKKRMRQFGKVDIPQAALIEALKMGDN